MKLETLRKKLMAMNPTQRQCLAVQSNVGVATLYRIIQNGYMPSMRTVEKIASNIK